MNALDNPAIDLQKRLDCSNAALRYANALIALQWAVDGKYSDPKERRDTIDAATEAADTAEAALTNTVNAIAIPV